MAWFNSSMTSAPSGKSTASQARSIGLGLSAIQFEKTSPQPASAAPLTSSMYDQRPNPAQMKYHVTDSG